MSTQFNSDDLAALELLLSKYKSPRGGRRWMVSQSTGAGGAPGTFSAPLDTFSEALSNSANGDQIYVLDGTFHGNVDASGKALDILGSAAGNVAFTHNGANGNGYTFTVGSDSTVRHITVSATGTAHTDTALAIADNAQFATVECCIINGKYDCLIAVSSIGFVGRRLFINGTYDSIQFGGATGFLLEDVQASVDGSWNSGNENTRAFVGDVGTNGTLRRCSLTSTKSNTGSGDTAAFECPGIVVLENCTLAASASNASYTHNVFGACESTVNNPTNAATRITLQRCNITTSTAGSGRACDISTVLGYIMDCGGNYFDKRKVTGNNIVSDPYEIDKLVRSGNIGIS